VNRYLYGAIAAIVYEYLSLLRPNSYMQHLFSTNMNANGEHEPSVQQMDDALMAFGFDDHDTLMALPSLVPAGERVDPDDLHPKGCLCRHCIHLREGLYDIRWRRTP
jgi:hypothetical protein